MTKLSLQLHEALSRVCPIDGVKIGRKNDKSTWSFTPSAGATAGQIASAQTILDGFTQSDLHPRTLLAIAADINALSGAKKNAIWADFTSGSPQKWSTNAGPNAAAMAVLHLVATLGTLSAADMLSAKVRAVAMYVQDNPYYLVNPSFDATINISGLA